MKKFHAAVNFIPETGRNVLCRLKELGRNSPTLKLDRSVFGDVPPITGENFVVEVGEVFQQGNYLLATSCKVHSREVQDAKPFDVDAYLASLGDTPDGQTGEEKDTF